MIIVAGHLPIAPEHRDAALAAIGECVAATRAEPGNLDYRMSPDLDDPNRLNILERWESQEALDAHLAAPHMATFLTAIGLINPPTSGRIIMGGEPSISTKLERFIKNIFFNLL